MNDTRDALLMAGVQLYSHLRADLLRGLTAGRVAETAGFHRQTFYRYWDTQAEYVQDLVRFVLDGHRGATPDGAGTRPDGPSGHVDFESFVRERAHHDFERFVNDPMGPLRVGLFAMRGGAPEVEALLEQFYERVMAELAAGYDALLRDWGREPTPPYGARDIARVLQSLGLGMALSVSFAREAVSPKQLHEQATVDILTTMTRPREAAAGPAGS